MVLVGLICCYVVCVVLSGSVCVAVLLIGLCFRVRLVCYLVVMVGAFWLVLLVAFGALGCLGV